MRTGAGAVTRGSVRSMHTLFRRNWRDDEGIAIVKAMGIIMVVAILAVTMVSYVLYTTKASGHQRQRDTALASAEAGIDATYVTLQASGISLPCTNTSPITAGIANSPDTGTYNVAITYTYSDGTNGACPTTDGKTPVSALIRSTGSVTSPVPDQVTPTRVMEAFVNLIPVRSNGFNKAIFANGNLSVDNQTNVNGQNGSDADVYTNNTFNCNNNETFHGSIYAQQGATFSNSCSIDGKVWTKLGISSSTGTNGTIGGDVLSSQGNISLSAGPTIAGKLQAFGTIANAACPARCYPGAKLADPPYQPFPIIRDDSTTQTDWVNHGYTVYSDPSCSTVKDDIINTYAKKGSKTLVLTDCAVNFSKDHTIPLSNDLAIFAKGGFSSANQVSFDTSSTGTKRMLYWIVPYNAAPGTYPASNCTATSNGVSGTASSPSISTDNQFGVTTDVDMLVYSPCAVSFANNSTHMGQIFGGS